MRRVLLSMILAVLSAAPVWAQAARARCETASTATSAKVGETLSLCWRSQIQRTETTDDTPLSWRVSVNGVVRPIPNVVIDPEVMDPGGVTGVIWAYTPLDLTISGLTQIVVTSINMSGESPSDPLAFAVTALTVAPRKAAVKVVR